MVALKTILVATDFSAPCRTPPLSSPAPSRNSPADHYQDVLTVIPIDAASRPGFRFVTVSR